LSECGDSDRDANLTARGGDVSGDEEEGNEEGCQEEEVVLAVSTLGAAPPSSTHNFILLKRVRQGEFIEFFFIASVIGCG
jgi:hypothetical protein